MLWKYLNGLLLAMESGTVHLNEFQQMQLETEMHNLKLSRLREIADGLCEYFGQPKFTDSAFNIVSAAIHSLSIRDVSRNVSAYVREHKFQDGNFKITPHDFVRICIGKAEA